MDFSREEARRIFDTIGVHITDDGRILRGFVCWRGRRLLAVHYSPAYAEAPPGVMRRFRNSLCLSEHEFERARSGAMNRDQYLMILERKGMLVLR